MPSSISHEATSRRLLHAADHQDSRRRRATQNRVLELNLGLARRLARRYRGRGVAQDDLDQVASLGLLKAIRRFDTDRRSFTAFAVPTVLGELRRYFRDSAWTVRPGRRVQEVQAAAVAAREELRAAGREPTTHEVAVRIGEPDNIVRHAESVTGAYSPRSLDAPAPGSDQPFGESLGLEDPAIERIDDLQTIAPAVRALAAADRRLLHMRFVEERTQQDIGRELGISQMQVSRRLAGVLGRIRRAAGTIDVQP